MTSVWRQNPSDFYDFWCVKCWGNLTAEDYKFVHLTCILWPYYLEKCKKVIFNNVIHMCFRIKWISTVTMHLSGRSLLIESVRSDVPRPLRGHNYGVCYAAVRSPHLRRSAARIQSMSRPAAAATQPQSTFRSTRVAHASLTRCDNP